MSAWHATADGCPAQDAAGKLWIVSRETIHRSVQACGLFHVKQSTEQIEARLLLFTNLLLRWTSRINLIGAGDRSSIRERHINDSLQLASFLPPDLERAIDLGSGGGFPGLILAIATAIPFELIEADRRKAMFLREAARVTDAPVTVHCARIEACRIPPARMVTARALAPLSRLLPLAARFLTQDGGLLLLKGQSADVELTHAAAEWQMQVQRRSSTTHASASIIQITGLRRVRSSNSD